MINAELLKKTQEKVGECLECPVILGCKVAPQVLLLTNDIYLVTGDVNYRELATKLGDAVVKKLIATENN